MEYNITPIETRYGGTLFRSRLEARWAACFDNYGWQWTYEPFDLDGWFPDFLLKSETSKHPDVLVEVKPITSFCDETSQRIQKSLVKTDNHYAPVLLLGVNPFWSEWDGMAVGWLLEYLGDPLGEYSSTECWAWDDAILRKVDWPKKEVLGTNSWDEPEKQAVEWYKACVDFCHASMSYHHRITGYYDGRSMVGNCSQKHIFENGWNNACEKVQYKPKGEN
tara:strand:+ start:19121 stop:19783 length:663 start_codon:yes stop_codon:yes gene_type:complete